VEPIADEILDLDSRERLRRRLVLWVRAHLEQHLRLLFEARRTTASGAARGLAFQVAEALGSLPRRRVATQVAALTRADRTALQALGLSIGRESIFFPRLLKPAAIVLRGILWSVHRKQPMPHPPAAGRVSVSAEGHAPAVFLEAVGYRLLGPRAVRVDILERFSAKVRLLAQDGAFVPDAALARLIGCDREALEAVLTALGYEVCASDGAKAFRSRERGSRPSRRRHGGRPPHRQWQDSPFAKLRDLPPPR
jgi:ATP-dependent RNA helicase SUPV3L1/SUV3